MTSKREEADRQFLKVSRKEKTERTTSKSRSITDADKIKRELKTADLKKQREAREAGEVELGLPEGEAIMNADKTVLVRRQWNDWQIATYRIEDIDYPHWSDTSGGINARAPREFLHCYVMCDQAIDGDVGHSCRHGSGPHRIKVCVTKKGNEGVFDTLRKMADAPGRDEEGGRK